MSDIFLMRQLENAKMAMTKRNVIRNVKCFFALWFFVVLKRSFVFFLVAATVNIHHMYDMFTV